MPYSSGGVTKNTFRYGPEVHKLHLEFKVKSGDTVHRGQPVFLNADGTISPAVKGTEPYAIIGVSIHEGGSAYGKDLVVVAMRAYTVIDAVLNSVADTNLVNAGPVAYAGYSTPPALANIYPQGDIAKEESRPSWNTSDPLTQGDNIFEGAAADGADAIGWSLTHVTGTPAAGAKTPILVALFS